jgi:[NiFe] hydrogenase diaphorase moiety large subunit
MTAEIEDLIDKYGSNRTSLLPVLQDIQIRYGHISDFAQQEVARMLDIHPVEVYGVITFYSFLSTEAKGKYIVRLCQTISCDLAGKASMAKILEGELGIKFGETTTDKKFSLEYVNCMGMCDQGPAMLINEVVYTKLTPHRIVEILKTYK